MAHLYSGARIHGRVPLSPLAAPANSAAAIAAAAFSAAAGALAAAAHAAAAHAAAAHAATTKSRADPASAPSAILSRAEPAAAARAEPAPAGTSAPFDTALAKSSARGSTLDSSYARRRHRRFDRILRADRARGRGRTDGGHLGRRRRGRRLHGVGS